MAQFSDISTSFGLDNKGDIAIVSDKAAIAQSIRTIINTSTGARPGSGSAAVFFGVNTKMYVFAPLDNFTASYLGESIQRQISIYEPRVEIESIEVEIDENNRQFNVSIYYSIIATEEGIQIVTVTINQI